MRSLGLGWAINECLYKGKEKEIWTLKDREGSHVRTDAEIGVKQPQAKYAWSHGELEEAGRIVS